MRYWRKTAVVWGTSLMCGTMFVAVFSAWKLARPASANAARPSDRKAALDEPLAEHNTLLDGSRLMSRIALRTTPAVVHIQAEHREGGKRIEETGSGVLVAGSNSSGAFVVTNSHVIRGATRQGIDVQVANGRLYHPTRVLEDRSTDIAVLQLPAADLPYATWGNSDQVEIGHVVLAMGSPFGLSRSVTFGIISAKSRRDLQLTAKRDVINQDFLQTDAAINPGNSGGPLIDLHGRIVGINTAIASNSGGNEGIGFSIPSNLARHVVSQLLAHGKVRRAYLGVKLDDEFDIATTKRLGLEHLHGARVIEVYRDPETPASRAGLKYDDVLISFNGVDVIDENHLINLVSLARVNERVRLIILRNRRRFAVEVVLTERETRAATERKRRRVPASPAGFSVDDLGRSPIPGVALRETADGLLVLDITDHATGPLQRFDVILQANGRIVRSLNDLRKLTGRQSDVLRIRRVADGGRETRLLML